jgi:hypothetical protein
MYVLCVLRFVYYEKEITDGLLMSAPVRDVATVLCTLQRCARSKIGCRMRMFSNGTDIGK